MKAEKIAKAIQEKWDAALEAERQREPAPHPFNWASELEHPCERFLTLVRLKWRERKPKSVEALYRITEGQSNEALLRQELDRLGFPLLEGQKRVEWPALQIVGRIDGKIQYDGDRIPVEIKWISPFLYDEAQSIKAIKESPSYWVRRIGAQLNLYLLLEGEEEGLLIIKTAARRPRLIEVTLDLEWAESIISKAERINKYVAENKIPEPIEWNSSLCDRCDMNHICLPIKPSLQDDIPADLEPKLKRYLELKEIVKEFEALEAELIGSKKEPGLLYGKNAIIGDFIVESRLIKSTTTKYENVPPECIKKVPIDYWRTIIRRNE